MIFFPCKEKPFYYSHKKFDSVISYLLLFNWIIFARSNFIECNYQHNKMPKTSKSKYIIKLSFISNSTLYFRSTNHSLSAPEGNNFQWKILTIFFDQYQVFIHKLIIWSISNLSIFFIHTSTFKVLYNETEV